MDARGPVDFSLDAPGYTLTKVFLQRGVGAIYLVAFLVALRQFLPLLGEKGLLPVPQFLKFVRFSDAPSLFHLGYSDRFFLTAAFVGLLLSLAAVSGLSERFGAWVSVGTWAVLYVLYLSIVNVGQTFYAFGWESMLLEAGFLAIFLGAGNLTPSFLVLLLFRWLLFRDMFGAGLIKIRGDECWRDFSCLFYHHETQPMPNPVSWYAHHLPAAAHRFGVLFNHVAELGVPIFYFFPQPFAGIAGVITLLFQGTLIVTGNFSFLNWLTVVLSFSTLDDRFFRWAAFLAPAALTARPPGFEGAIFVLTILFVLLSYRPLVNLLSPRQLMNFSFNPFHLVSTYGAFGSVTKERVEVILEGTDAADPRAPDAVWRAYEVPGKPGDPARRPPQIAPYHYRLGWVLWFVPFSPGRHPLWLLRFIDKLLAGDPLAHRLLATNPFPDRPPRWIRADWYRYRFTKPAERRATGHWWQRERLGAYLPPLSLDTPGFRDVLQSRDQLVEEL